MRDLQLVALSEDGAHLVLSDGSGADYRVAADERLRAAVRQDRARLGQLQIELESQLRPAEMQARMRAGETAEQVAIAAGVPVEKVRRYEGPVLAEREHTARTAQRAVVRHAASGHATAADYGTDGGPLPRFGALVADRVQGRGVDPEALAWDSYRRDDGRWQVLVGWRVGRGETRASWVYDPQRQVVMPDDDQARWLVDPDARAGAEPDGDDASRRPRRLASVPQEHLPGAEAGDGELREAADGAPSPRETAAGSGASRASSPEPAAPTEPGGKPVERRVAAGAGMPPVELDPVRPAGAAPAPEQPAHHPASGDTGRAAGSAAGSAASGGAAASEREPVRRQASAGGGKGRRAAVPSWDEIVFGARPRA